MPVTQSPIDGAADIVDFIGQRFQRAPAHARIASLVPSLTETLVDLGLAAQLVARTGFCIRPAAAVRAIPKVGGTKDVNLARLRDLAPTHALVNVDENTLETVEQLREFVPHVVVTHPQHPDDNLSLFNLLGALFSATAGVQERAQSLHDEFGNTLRAIRARSWPLRRVLYVIWREPWMTVARDTYIARTLGLVGWQTFPDVAGGDGLRCAGATRYPVFDWDAPWLQDVDLVLLASEPFRFGAAHVEFTRGLLETRGLHAAVRLIDGEWASWYGSRALGSLPQLSQCAAALPRA
ncbi:MAG: ABC transporter substrate-binding protein [Proteobacteria bacterium]|nr:ABC transporter substrate-binding protein [Pseudomonadota bacterium]